MEEENIVTIEENIVTVEENDFSEDITKNESNIDYTDILQHISDSVDGLYSSNSELEESEGDIISVYSIDDLYSLGSIIVILLVVSLVLRVFHSIRRPLTDL